MYIVYVFILDLVRVHLIWRLHRIINHIYIFEHIILYIFNTTSWNVSSYRYVFMPAVVVYITITL